MTIKMTTSMSGADFSLKPGDETDRFSAKEERRLIKAGFAEKTGAKKGDTEPELEEDEEDAAVELPVVETTSETPPPETRG